MAQRKIIRIDEELCNGCGECVTACAEGALQVIDGKARLVKEEYCDGLGDCLGECPTGALRVVEMDVPEYNPESTLEHVRATGGQEAATRFEQAQQRHASRQNHNPGGSCPGMRERFEPKTQTDQPAQNPGGPGSVIPSELRQWPIQLHLVRPGAPYFKDRELLVLNSCGAVSSADVHWRYLRGRAVVIACPKLDRTEGYVEKLAEILREASIPKVLVVRMEVPCCGGLTALTRRAIELSGRSDLEFEEITLSLNGEQM